MRDTGSIPVPCSIRGAVSGVLRLYLYTAFPFLFTFNQNIMIAKERIPIFLEKVNWNKLAERWNLDISAFDTIRPPNEDVNPKIVRYWKKHSYLRFGQLLINLNLLSDNIKIWTDDELSILLDQGLPAREIMFWGSIYSKNRKSLKRMKWRLIKDLSIDHIKAIIQDVEDYRMCVRRDYLKVFKEELKLRLSNENKKG